MTLFKTVYSTIGALALGFVMTTGSAEAGRFYDPVTAKWQEYGNGKTHGKSSVRRKAVSFEGNHKAGTIIVNTKERRLYHVLGNGKAMKYGIGVGKQGFTWAGTNRITRKAEWPGWTPPAAMRKREAAKGRILPAHMKGGIENPLGARALYLGHTIYRIHGTNQPWTIGQAVSSGCIRMTNEDVEHLYTKVKVGAKVIVK